MPGDQSSGFEYMIAADLFGVNTDSPCVRVLGSAAERRRRARCGSAPVWTGHVASADDSLTMITGGDSERRGIL